MLSSNLSGLVGSLFKVRLSAYGYTLVAKCVEVVNLAFLQHEKEVYDQLYAIQWKDIPVGLGLIHPGLQQYCDCGVFQYFLLLSWAGRPLSKYIDQIDKTRTIRAITTAFTRLHRMGILHGDAEARNLLLCDGGPMIVDFEGASPAVANYSAQSTQTARVGGGSVGCCRSEREFTRELKFVV